MVRVFLDGTDGRGEVLEIVGEGLEVLGELLPGGDVLGGGGRDEGADAEEGGERLAGLVEEVLDVAEGVLGAGVGRGEGGQTIRTGGRGRSRCRLWRTSFCEWGGGSCGGVAGAWEG